MAARSNKEDLHYGHPQRVLSEALECAESLLDVLAREQKCLRERDLEGITSTAAEKARLVATFEQLDEQGRTVAQLPRDSACRLRDLLRRCHIQNRINGHAIQAVAKHVDRSVQILQGVSGTASVYGADGETMSLSASRYMTRA